VRSSFSRESNEKTVIAPRVFRRLFAMLRPSYPAMVVALALLFFSMPGELFPAFVWQYVTDDLILSKFSQPSGLHWMMSFEGRISNPYHLLYSALTWLMSVYLISTLAGTISTVILQRAAQKFVYSLRNRVYHKLQSQSLGYLQRQRTGDLMSRAISDVDELQNFVVNSIDLIIGDGVLWLATVAIVVYKSWEVAGSSLFPLIIVYFMLRHFNAKVKPIYAAARQRAGDVSNRLQENLAGVTVIKIFGREREEASRFDQSTNDYYVQQLKAITARNLFFPFSSAVGFFSNVFMIGVGGYLLLKYPKGTFTVGTLLLFRAYWWRLFGPVQTLARVNDLVQRAGAAGTRVFEVLDAPEELPDAADAIEVGVMRGALELRDVSFRYPPESPDKPQPVILRHANISVEPGQTVALCGPSGAGKSTVLNLLLRFYDPMEGHITVDGRDIRSIQRESLRRHFALVQQESFLFNDSVIDNIRYGHPEATMEQVIAAAKAANADAFITKLTNGYNTKVGERGVRLSGGQKQRISIARAFLANPSVLLLDEPTSSVEPDSEAAIIAALDRLMAGRTTVLTSHRPSLISQADVVYIIDDGQIADSGSPADLLQRNEWFGRFMRSAEDALV
jgi:ABC-type multidrug transport system fused ATPase/permease subunit